jgi:hypothetical protein
MADPDKFVFIATGGLISETVDFGNMAMRRMVHLVTDWNALIKKKTPPFSLPATVRFIQFNFESGAVLMLDHLFPDKGIKVPSEKLSDWTPVSIDGTVDTTLHQNNLNSTKTLSITNVYQSVRLSPANSVLEVSIFSHAFVQGPVLVNTDDDPSSPNRSLTDMDGRARTDFNPNMGEAAAGDNALDEFIKAFDKTAHFRVYGCNVQDVVGRREIVGNVAASGAVRQSNIVTITTTTPHGQDTGQRVEISSVPDTTFNARFTIASVPSTTTFTYSQTGADGTSGPGIVATAGRDPVAKIASDGAVRASNIVTIQTTTDHKLGPGQQVLISGVSDKSFNGRFVIKTASTTTFTYSQKGADATSGPGTVSTPGGSSYKRSAAWQVIDQAFLQPSKGTAGASLRAGKAPTSDVVLDMWVEMMNEAERDVGDEAIGKARAQGKPRKDWDTIAKAAWTAVSAKDRNKLANGLLVMHRQLDPDFYPEPNATDSTAAPTVTKVSKSWAAILGLLSKKMSESYIFKAADKLNATGITCHGAVPGVGGNNEPDTRDLGLMRICGATKSFGCDNSFGPWLNFYKLFFFLDAAGKKLDTAFDDRNYAQLDSKAVAIVKARATP